LTAPAQPVSHGGDRCNPLERCGLHTHREELPVRDAPGGRLIVIEMLVGQLDELGPPALTDLTMMVVNAGGRQRSLAELQTLLEAADFRIARVCLTTTPASIIEATAF
jgi:O-methyltransferase domain